VARKHLWAWREERKRRRKKSEVAAYIEEGNALSQTLRVPPGVNWYGVIGLCCAQKISKRAQNCARWRLHCWQNAKANGAASERGKDAAANGGVTAKKRLAAASLALAEQRRAAAVARQRLLRRLSTCRLILGGVAGYAQHLAPAWRRHAAGVCYGWLAAKEGAEEGKGSRKRKRKRAGVRRRCLSAAQQRGGAAANQLAAAARKRCKHEERRPACLRERREMAETLGIWRRKRGRRGEEEREEERGVFSAITLQAYQANTRKAASPMKRMSRGKRHGENGGEEGREEEEEEEGREEERKEKKKRRVARSAPHAAFSLSSLSAAALMLGLWRCLSRSRKGWPASKLSPRSEYRRYIISTGARRKAVAYNHLARWLKR
jgi:hypothetical protein